MAITKITEKTVTASVSSSAYCLITQPETINGVSTESLRRATVPNVIGSAQTLTDAQKTQARANIGACSVSVSGTTLVIS